MVFGVFNETDYGRKGIQYIHYPTYLRPRPEVDMRWYHAAAGGLNVYYALADRIADFSLARMKQNVSLVNSDWTGGHVSGSSASRHGRCIRRWPIRGRASHGRSGAAAFSPSAASRRKKNMSVS